MLSNKEGESSLSESKWLEHDESLAVWVKCRGKWQATIKCARADWPLSTVKAKPTHDRKKYLVIFFPRKRNYSWEDVLLVRSINEFPEPIAYRTQSWNENGERFDSCPVSMLNIIDQLHTKALSETAHSVMVWKEFAMEASCCKGCSDLGRMLLKVWKEFAMEASRCKGYSDLGRMLLKLHNATPFL